MTELTPTPDPMPPTRLGRLALRARAPAWVRSEVLNVATDVVGLPLAPLGRRLAALGIDVAVVAVLSRSGAFWIAAGIGALVWQLRHRRTGRGAWRTAALWLVLAWLVFLGAQRGTESVQRWLSPPTATTGRASTAADDDDADAKVPGLGPATAIPARPASAAASDPAIALADAQARISSLEQALADAHRPAPPRTWRDQLSAGARQLGFGFGWAAAYFTLLTCWWRGQTVGKRLLGIQVRELTGRPLTLMTCFGRYGGYAAGMATGGAGFAQVLWDPNRQAIQDKLAHTVVVDLRAGKAATSGADSH